MELSHWDFVSSFQPREASALILGLDPSSPDADLSTTLPVQTGMQQWFFPVRFHPHAMPREERPRNLYSVQLLRAIESGDASKWGASKEAEWADQYFTGRELARWLKEHQFKSNYEFDRSVRDASNESGSVQRERWPWGDHTTEALSHLEAAARRFWVNYDPAEPSSANTNATVAEWLQTERRVSQKLANSIASLLRADDIPTGPRRTVP